MTILNSYLKYFEMMLLARWKSDFNHLFKPPFSLVGHTAGKRKGGGMAEREDGRETRLRVLHAACEVFAAMGYPAAKVATICRQAGANVASVNYYFGSKASLYEEAWRYALETLNERVTLDFGADTDTPHEALRSYIVSLVRHFSAKTEMGLFSRLYLRELVNPTGLIKDAWHELIEPRRRFLHGIIRRIIGPGAEDLTVLLCEQSIINQCRALLTIKREDLEYMLDRPLSPELVQRFAEHIADFSLAGIEAAGRRERHPQ